jgi:hypothetical protein
MRVYLTNGVMCEGTPQEIGEFLDPHPLAALAKSVAAPVDMMADLLLDQRMKAAFESALPLSPARPPTPAAKAKWAPPKKKVVARPPEPAPEGGGRPKGRLTLDHIIGATDAYFARKGIATYCEEHHLESSQRVLLSACVTQVVKALGFDRPKGYSIPPRAARILWEQADPARRHELARQAIDRPRGSGTAQSAATSTAKK